MKVLAIIPARGGSKGIKNKNIIPLNNKPLIFWTIKAAFNSKVFSDIMVSTESEEIAETARCFGAKVPFLRSKKLALDTSKTIDCVIEVLNNYRLLGKEFDVVVLLQPTSPLRDSEDIREAYDLFIRKDRMSLASVVKAKNIVLMRKLGNNGELVFLENESCTGQRRQDLEPHFVLNGAIYINQVSEITEATNFNHNKIAFVMDTTKSLDIDDGEDLMVAEALQRYLLMRKD